ncbi:peptide ABC transporter substrate-binding protein [Bacillus cereus]|uniref:Peptide ABC transporter substrate-binding protein n=2 Tax=Bacillaceae TaxID=186817 RepID=A0A9W7QH14_BACCE|nr:MULTISPECIES: peptide ABC transporter substrate-binding protein [Bacillus cereus group]KAB2397537.1 peptide ABC transporter substrate-binding protein [Bacillus cereus]KAB2403008.1 peptide ABC transporter substrate-binding protein [Bacillus cereus]KAB2431729.1 peptide ABC transporter substrate-binding protein [Bacillus cereus]MDA1615817.1 peptide ABC transporter substrate-binding protein [Bacillus cereus group sp. TH204-1LC]PEE23403.1 peptide ABC transporter substrate-binding protein [Bacill
MEFLMTEKQKQVYWKKKRLVELKLEGLTHKQVREQLNEELRDKGLKEISLSYVKVYWSQYMQQQNMKQDN